MRLLDGIERGRPEAGLLLVFVDPALEILAGIMAQPDEAVSEVAGCEPVTGTSAGFTFPAARTRSRNGQRGCGNLEG